VASKWLKIEALVIGEWEKGGKAEDMSQINPRVSRKFSEKVSPVDEEKRRSVRAKS